MCLFSGVVKTKHYEEKYQPNLVETQVSYEVMIYPPRSVYDNKNITLHLLLDKLYMVGKKSRTNSVFMEEAINFDQNVIYKNFSPPVGLLDFDKSKQLSIQRDIPFSYLSTTKANMMPGFRLRWWYTGNEVKPEPLVPHLKHDSDSFTKIIFVK